MSEHFEPIFSKYQCGFRKEHSAQHCLLEMIEKWNKCLDKKGTCGALLTDLSKIFDCLPHKLLLAKLNVYGFDESSLKYMKNYLSDREQRVKINNSINWINIFYGVPQGSVLDSVLFHIFLCDLFVFLPNIDIASYEDNNTPYAMNKSTNEVVRDIKMAS